MRYRIPLLKRAVPSMKKRLAWLTSKRGFTLKQAHGALFLLHYGNYVDRQIAFYDDYEYRQIDTLLNAMRVRGCDLFVDIGANIGVYTILVAKSGAAARVVAFEPDERNRMQLGANLLLNRLTNKVTIFDDAVTSCSGQIAFCPSPDSSTGQSIIAAGAGSITVNAVALDDIFAEEGKRVFIKLDIEGHELEAIRGMSELLRRNQVYLQIESFTANAQRLVDMLSALNFKQVTKIENDSFFTNFD